MTPTRNEAAERLLHLIQAEHGYDFTESVDEALAAERAPLLAALRALVEPLIEGISDWDTGAQGGKIAAAISQTRALIEQDGRE